MSYLSIRMTKLSSIVAAPEKERVHARSHTYWECKHCEFPERAQNWKNQADPYLPVSFSFSLKQAS